MVMSRQHSRFGWAPVAQGKILALLLVGTLFLCHGVFGALHLCTTLHADSATQHTLHDHSPEGMGAGPHDHQACDLMHAANYYAVLLTTFVLGMFLGLLLLLKNMRLWSRIPVSPSAFFRSFWRAKLYT